MMGQATNQDQLFYSFSLEDHIPRDHLLRGVNRFLDLSALRQHLAPFYSHTGRPSIDPELMIRMLIIGYCFGIRSERRLCEEVHLNLAYRWFCQLGLEDKIPDHSTFSKNRHGRFRESETFRHVFETVLRRCMSEGLVGGEGFAVDASIIKADANRANVTTPEEPKDWPGGDMPSRAVRDYLAALEEANPTQGDATSVTPATTPRVISLSDPQARYTAAPGGPAFFAYSTNYLIDLDAGIIMDVEATQANRTQEVNSTKTMVQRIEDRFGIKPNRLVGDTAYGTAPMLNWMVNEKQIEPHVRIWDKTQRKDDTLSSSEFFWNEEANEYRCPEGFPLKSSWRPFKSPRTHITQEDTIVYRASQHDCGACSRKMQCCPNTPHRKITRSIHEGARDVARKIAETDAFKQSGRQRKKVEMLFAHLKRILKLDRLRLRGLAGARDEFILAATAQNLRRMAKWLTPGNGNLGLATA
jgi:transposase